MEEQERMFYESELDFFGDQSYPTFRISTDPNYPILDTIPIQSQPTLRAIKPLDLFRDLPEQRQLQCSYLFSNRKLFPGIQHFFQFGKQEKFSGQFLENIAVDALGNSGIDDFQLQRLFVGESKHPYKQQLQNSIITLQQKLSQTNQKYFATVNINRTISNAFHQHFKNYSIIADHSSFFQEFKIGLNNLLISGKRHSGPGIQLITSIYDFWMRSFKDFVNEIWKHSSKFTQWFLKKAEVESSQAKSQSSNTMGSREKRKGWCSQETEALEKLINSNIIFSQSVLKTISEQLHRSPSSIAAKLQKLIKTRKNIDVNPEQTLLRKAVQVLKMYPQGLNRQAIIQKMNEHYQMGYGGQWQKSVGQLLSSRKQFIKLKTKYKLINPHLHSNPINLDQTKMTIKDKVINAFLRCHNAEADIKTLLQRYIQLFQNPAQLDDQKKKGIQANIMKALSRYDIFDGKSKTLYLLNPLLIGRQKNFEQEMGYIFQL